MDAYYWWKKYPPNPNEPDIAHITERVKTGETPGGSECDIYVGQCGDECPMYSINVPMGYGPWSGTRQIAEDEGCIICPACLECSPFDY